MSRRSSLLFLCGSFCLVALVGCGPSEQEVRRQGWEALAPQLEPKIAALVEANAQFNQGNQEVLGSTGPDDVTFFQGMARIRRVCATSREAIEAFASVRSTSEDAMVSAKAAVLSSSARSIVLRLQMDCRLGSRGLLENAGACDRACVESWRTLREDLNGIARYAARDGVEISSLEEPSGARAAGE